MPVCGSGVPVSSWSSPDPRRSSPHSGRKSTYPPVQIPQATSLVTRLRISRLFSTDEVAFLVTIGAQLAGAINHATAGDAISRLLSEQPQPLRLVQGIAATPDVGIGTIVLCSPLSNLVSVPDREPQDIDAEEAAFRAAVVAVRKELRAGGERLASALPAEARAVLDAYMTLLDGDHLITDTIKRVRAGNWAPGALRDAIAEYAQVFDQMEDPYLCARAEDIRGIGRRILMSLKSYVSNPTRYPQYCILVGEEISIGRIAEVPVGQLSDIVCTRGSVFSHAAILARALGIPAAQQVAVALDDEIQHRIQQRMTRTNECCQQLALRRDQRLFSLNPAARLLPGGGIWLIA